jgi:GNAT superfamily N-acetyltransferase
MDRAELLKIFDREQRMEWTAPNSRREQSGGVVRNIIPSENSGFISYSALDQASVDAEIEAQIDYFRGLGYDFEWKVYDHDRPADLRQRLAAHGLVIEDPEALVVLDLEDAPSFYWTLELPAITRIRTQAGVDDVMRMEEAVWGDDHTQLGQFLWRFIDEHPDFMEMFAIYQDGRVASAAWILYHPPTQFASLWGGSTLNECRGRGYYTALLAIRAREARRRGFRFLTVDASPMSRPILEKHGFQFLGFSTPVKWKPGGEGKEKNA